MPRIGKDGLPPQGGSSGKFINQIMLREDKEKSILRFITDFDDFYYERYHRNMVGGDFKGYKVCVREALGQPCGRCSQEEPTSLRFSGWVFEKTHYYRKYFEFKNPEKKLTKDGEIWKLDINAPVLLEASIMHFNPIEFRHDMYGTLLNREYSWIRVGEKDSRRPTYMLEPEAESEYPKDLLELKESLPDLEDIALGKVKSLDGEVQEAKPYATVAVKDPFADKSSEEEPGF